MRDRSVVLKDGFIEQLCPWFPIGNFTWLMFCCLANYFLTPHHGAPHSPSPLARPAGTDHRRERRG